MSVILITEDVLIYAKIQSDPMSAHAKQGIILLLMERIAKVRIYVNFHVSAAFLVIHFHTSLDTPQKKIQNTHCWDP